MPLGTPQVRILNTGWFNTEGIGSTPGTFTVHPDIDGHSVWCFQYFGTGVKKIDLTTNTVSLSWTFPYTSMPTMEDGTVFFAQDSQGYCYTFTNFVSNSSAATLKKLNPASAMAEVASLTLTAGVLSNTPEDWVVYQSGGQEFIAVICNSNSASRAKWAIINLTTMTLVNNGLFTAFQVSLNNEKGYSVFKDASNNIWFVTATATGTIVTPHFYKSVGNATPTAQFTIPGTTTNFSSNCFAAFCTYIPSTNAAFLANNTTVNGGWTGDMITVDLATGNVTNILKDNANRSFYSGTFDAPWSAMRAGVQNGNLLIPGDDPTVLTNRGGYFNLMTAANLTITDTVNITNTILTNAVDAAQNSPGLNWLGTYSGATTYHYGDAVQGSNGLVYIRQSTGNSDPVTEQNTADASTGLTGWANWVPLVPNKQKDNSISSLILNVAITSNVLTINTNGTFSNTPKVGQLMTIYGISTGGGPTFLNGQTVTVTSATSSQIKANFTHADYPQTACNGNIAGKLYPPNGNLLWLDSSKKLLVTYEYVGSLVYLLDFNPQIATSTSIAESPNPAYSAENVTLTATVTPASGSAPNAGTVQFYDGATPIGAPVAVSGGTAQYVTRFTVGSHSVSAVYSGSGAWLTSTSPTDTLNINQTPTATGINVAPNPTDPSVTVNVTATITATAGTSPANPTIGTVQFYDGINAIGSPVAVDGSSQAVYSHTFSTGTHAITAQYTDASGNYGNSTSPSVNLVINQAQTTTVLTTTGTPTQFLDEVTFQITVTSNDLTIPTGTVTLTDTLNNVPTVLATLTLDANGQTAYTTNALAIGAHSISAFYNGDGPHGTSLATILQQVTDAVIVSGLLPGFALVATFSEQGDSALPPSATFSAVPNTTTAGTTIFLLWNTVNISAVRFTANNGVDSPLDTGKISTSGSGVYTISAGFSKTTLVTMTAYDLQGQLALTSVQKVTIS